MGLKYYDFECNFNDLQEVVHDANKKKGYWDKPYNDCEKLCLIHSEVTEAMEAVRYGNPKDKQLPQHSNLEVELADIIIRIMDYAGGKNFKLGQIITDKIKFNETRNIKNESKLF